MVDLQLQKLAAEAEKIRDPGGPLLGAYSEALEAWAATHPEVPYRRLQPIIDRLLREHR
ncbi:hypothetical protein IWX75_003112 [Arthrobacter sp. CAN_A6]